MIEKIEIWVVVSGDGRQEDLVAENITIQAVNEMEGKTKNIKEGPVYRVDIDERPEVSKGMKSPFVAIIHQGKTLVRLQNVSRQSIQGAIEKIDNIEYRNGQYFDGEGKLIGTKEEGGELNIGLGIFNDIFELMKGPLGLILIGLLILKK